MVSLLKAYLAPYRWELLLVGFLLLIQAVGQLFLPNLNADIINNGVLTGDAVYILRIGAIMLLLTLFLSAAAVIGIYFSARIAMRFGQVVRGDLFRQVQLFSLREVNSFGTPSLITRNTNDVQQVQLLVLMGLTMMVSAPIMAVGGVIMAIREDVQLSALLLVVIPVMLIVIGLLVWQTVPLFRVMQVKIDRINLVLREQLSGVRVIRAFVRTGYERERFAEANDDLTATTLRVTRLFALMMPSLMLILNLSTVAILWFGGHLIDAGSMPIGNLTAFLSYVMQILFAVMMAVMMVIMIPRATASGERIEAVLTTEPRIADPASASATTPQTGVVEMRDVEFRYPGAQDAVLSGINLVCRPGTTTAIVGSTGSGKTTLINLISRLYDPTKGSIRIDGIDVLDLPLERLWACLGVVPQKSFLFSGTIASNLAFGRPEATDAQMWRALGIAQASDFVAGLSEGLQAAVDQGGANFSGGQRQRLAIARALVREPLIYVFDDSFSALDYATDARLRVALRTATTDSTVIIVAQRVSSIMHADQIVVLDAGRIVGIGTHDALLESCETYREIVLSQLRAEEVA